MPKEPFDFSNPFRTAIMKHAFELLGDRYGKYQELLVRLTTQTVTTKDATEFSQFMVDLFEVGFLRAVDEYKKSAGAQGLQIRIIPSTEAKRNNP